MQVQLVMLFISNHLVGFHNVAAPLLCIQVVVKKVVQYQVGDNCIGTVQVGERVEAFGVICIGVPPCASVGSFLPGYRQLYLLCAGY